MSENSTKSIIHQSTASTSSGSGSETTKSDKTGWLLKWTNYLKGEQYWLRWLKGVPFTNSCPHSSSTPSGYQKRWFVLSNGVLSYYRWVLYVLYITFSIQYCISMFYISLLHFTLIRKWKFKSHITQQRLHYVFECVLSVCTFIYFLYILL